MKLDFTKHLSNNRQKRINTTVENFFLWTILTASILGCLWILSS